MFLYSVVAAINLVAVYINLKPLRENDYPDKLFVAFLVATNGSLALYNLAYLAVEVLQLGLVK